ncbi:hypothetical protein AMTRI_Chr12g271700 [Amborella trichopoda]|uniref:uncharacterized protein LOC105420394 n=1 Tax=Amborella trichopoda TaxID=13333 RepID=UPI0005D34945|nr:uncharacterized protein LOC105420394 [Amborella trichopoda]|eukprot:XP_011622125.1 uncharacterized protein LOC105420394 [Amborella trichopoda]
MALLPTFSSTSNPFSLKNSMKPQFQSLVSKPTVCSKEPIPSMSELMASSLNQNMKLHLKTLGPFFRVTATSLATQQELGRAEGFIKLWFNERIIERILHLDSIKMRRETIGMERSIFGLGLFVGAVAIRHGYDSGCRKAELLSINDSDYYHSKLVRFYTRMGFKPVHEVTGSSIGDVPHLLIWGGRGTRMDANIEELLIKWGTRFKAQS